MRTLLAVFITLALTGCSSLILRDSDSNWETSGKVASRVILAPMTLGISELAIYHAREREQCEAQGLWWDNFWGRCGTWADQERARQLAPAAMGLFNQYIQNMRPVAPPPVYQPPTLQPIVPLPSKPLNCQSWVLHTTGGDIIQTTCY
jgi:hypothetical protein